MWNPHLVPVCTCIGWIQTPNTPRVVPSREHLQEPPFFEVRIMVSCRICQFPMFNFHQALEQIWFAPFNRFNLLKSHWMSLKNPIKTHEHSLKLPWKPMKSLHCIPISSIFSSTFLTFELRRSEGYSRGCNGLAAEQSQCNEAGEPSSWGC